MKTNKIINIVSGLKAVEKDGDDLYITGMASTKDVDRIGDVIEPEAWKDGLGNFNKNPIILFNHNYDRPIGKATNLEINEDGLKITAKISKAAGDIYHLIKDGILQAFSVGFLIEDAEWDDTKDIFRILKANLLETSVVSIPMNQEALFSVGKSFDTEDEWRDYLKQFKKLPDEPKGEAVKATETPEEKSDSAEPAKKESNKMDPEEIQKLIEEKLAKATADLEEKQKAAEAQKAADAAEAANADRISELEAGLTGAEKLAADLKEELAKKDADMAETLKKFQDDLEEKATELEALRNSKARFTDRNGDEASRIKTYGEEFMHAHMLGVITGKGYDTDFAKNLAEKAGINYTTNAPDLDQEIQDRIQKEVTVYTRVADLFREISVNGASTVLPFQGDVGHAAWAADAPAGNLTNRPQITANQYNAKQVILTAERLVSSSFINNDTDEQVLVNLMPMLVDGVARAHARAVEGALLLGNSSDIDGLDSWAAASSAVSAIAVGSAGSLTAANLLAMRSQMGKFGLNPEDVAFIVNQAEYYSLLADGAFANLNEVGEMATKIKGIVGGVYGSPVIVSDEFAAPADGAPCAFAVNVRNYVIPRLRGIKVEQDYEVMNQRRVIVASQALGFTEIQAGDGSTFEPSVSLSYTT